MVFLLRLYEVLPGWLVAIALLAASGSWFIHYHWLRRYEMMPLYPPMSLALGIVLTMLGLFYLWLGVTPGLPADVRAGGVRLLLLVLSAAMVAYNGGMVTRLFGKIVKAIKQRE